MHNQLLVIECRELPNLTPVTFTVRISPQAAKASSTAIELSYRLCGVLIFFHAKDATTAHGTSWSLSWNDLLTQQKLRPCLMPQLKRRTEVWDRVLQYNLETDPDTHAMKTCLHTLHRVRWTVSSCVARMCNRSTPRYCTATGILDTVKSLL